MVSATECLYIYQQLVLMLQELGMDDVVKSVEEEWTTFDAITGEEQLVVEGADSLLSHTPSPKKQRKSSSHKPPSHATQGRRVLLLLNAIEHTLAQPTFQGLAVMNM